MSKPRATEPSAPRSTTQSAAACGCGAVRMEIDVPAVWAWHDHSAAGRRAHGGACATYVGSWKSRFRILQGEDCITRFQDEASGAVRGFCARCGAPLTYERPGSPKMINIPRGLFETRTGREPRYHLGVPETADWEYAGASLTPLKGFPGVMYERPRRTPPRTARIPSPAHPSETTE